MRNLIELLLHSAEAEGQRDFLVGEGISYTYEKAANVALSIACYLRHQGIQGENVLFFSRQRPETIIGFLGIAGSLNAYVPIDPDQAKNKIDAIIEKASIRYQLCFDEEPLPGLTPIRYEEATSYEPSATDVHGLFLAFDVDKPAYIVFTSGSTGVPKGVAKSHRAMLAFVENFLIRFPLAHEKMANQSPFYFDASMKDVYLSMGSRSTLFIPDKSRYALPTKIMEYLQENGITYLCWVPSALSIIARLRLLKHYPLPSLKYVFFVGEVFPAKYLNAWREAYPQATFVNLYGSSELAGVCLYYVVDKDLLPEQAIPLGKPLPFNEVYLSDGEIVVASEQIALGYLDEPSRNATTFVQSEGKTLLHTGDYGYKDEGGNIVFSCRKDFQIKHMGHRIELQEIELAFLSLPYIGAACCVNEESGDKLILFASSNEEGIDERRILLDAKPLLPPYMLPNKVVILDALPLSPNGKIDRVALKKTLEK